MKRSALYFLLALVSGAIFFLSIPSALATSYSTTTTTQPITLKLDKESYNKDDIMIISGEINRIVNRIPLTIQIMNPTGNLVHVDQIEVASDGKFSLPIKLGGPAWTIPGNYTLTVQYGFKHISSVATFQFEEMGTLTSGVINIKEKNGGQNFDLNYTITGGKVKTMYLEPQDLALVVEVDAKDNGNLHVIIPRLMLDATKSDGMDETFLVYVNEDERYTFTEEKSSSTSRVLDIPISPGDTKIEILGTTVIPEFGGIVPLVLVISLVSIVLISAKSRLVQKF